MSWIMVMVIVIVMVILYGLMRLNLYLYLEYRRKLNDDYASCKILLFDRIELFAAILPLIKTDNRHGLLRALSKIKLKYPGLLHKKSTVRGISRFKINLISPRQVIHFFKDIWQWTDVYRKFIRLFCNNLKCKYWYWQTKVGEDDAALTGAAVGAIWLVKSSIMRHIQNNILFESLPIIGVVPNFKQKTLQIEFKCILRIRVGHVIKAGFELMMIIGKGVTTKRWLNTRFKV